MKNENGITMIMMVITVVMMALIAVFSISNSRETVVETKIIKTYDEMKTVKKAVMEYLIMDDLDDLDVFKITSLSSYPGITSKYPTEEQSLYYLDFRGDSNLLNDLLEVRNVQNNYIVNVFHTNDVEIFLDGGIEIGGTKYYNDQDILEQYNDVFAGR